MATVAEANALLSQYDSLVLSAVSNLSALLDSMSAISPADPNASTKLQELESRYQSIRSRTGTQMAALYARYSAAYDSLTPAQQTEASNSPEAQKHKQVVATVAANKGRHDSVYNNKNLEIQKANATAPTPSVTQTATPSPTAPSPTINTVANDDSGATQANSAGSTGSPTSASPSAAGAVASGNGNSGPATPANTSSANNSGTTGTAGSTTSGPVLRTEASKTQPPGKRLKNPLGYFSSYTYQISLYMITPDGYDAFIQSGRKNINVLNEMTGGKNAGGAFLVAQSGGINNAQEDRAPGFAFDYSIDNLSFDTICAGKAGEGDTNTTSIKFTITEPYGFSFISNLKRARDALDNYSKNIGTSLQYDNKQNVVKSPQNATKQFFILGIRFFGYDENGNLMTGKEVFDGTTLDPNASGTGPVFERFYDIVITEMKFRIDGKAVTYNISAASLAPDQAFSVKRGQVDKDISIEASNVEEALTQMVDKLNQRQAEIFKDTPDLHNTYEIVFIGDAKTVIGKSKIVSPADLDKLKWPGSGAKSTSESNDKTATNSGTPNSTKRQLTISTGTPIPAAINNVILQSQFLEQGLKTVYTTALEPPKNKNAMDQVDSNSKKVLKWYNCSAEIRNARWNQKIKDWVYDIKYIIQTYETPVIDSAYANATTKYYGPHKRYEYWYTGKNSEIISYQQELNNTYFTVAVVSQDTQGEEGSSTDNTATDNSTSGQSGNGQTGSGDAATVPAKTQEQSTEGKLGPAAKEAQNSYLTSLNDPASLAEAKITILGDPDFIMVDSSYSEEQLYHKFYGPDGFSINPNGGQVFIEIDFKEAVDYSSDKVNSGGGAITGEPGTLSINESILFWQYPDDIAKLVKGISYQVLKVTSTFSNGTFKQVLDTRVNTFANASKPSSGAGREPESNKNKQTTGNTPASGSSVPSGPTPGAANTTNKDSGLRPDVKPPLVVSSFDTPIKVAPINTDTLIREISVPTLTGPVVDDDALSTAPVPSPNLGAGSESQQREPLENAVFITGPANAFNTEFPLA